MPDPPDHDPLSRALGVAIDPRDGPAAAEARAVAAALDAVAVPPPDLPGWQSLCATEYAAAVRLLQREIALARGALSIAERALG